LKTTYVIDDSRNSIISLVAYFLAKSLAEKLFTARRFTNKPSINNKRSRNGLILHIDTHINGVTSVNGC
jgi:hypothetical protein